jgi:hypothetical protein
VYTKDMICEIAFIYGPSYQETVYFVPKYVVLWLGFGA